MTPLDDNHRAAMDAEIDAVRAILRLPPDEWAGQIIGFLSMMEDEIRYTADPADVPKWPAVLRDLSYLVNYRQEKGWWLKP